MPRYYFNLRSDAEEVTDVVGESCRDEVAALALAFDKAGEIARKRVFGDGWIGDARIQVEDERARIILTLPVRAAAY
ncbi:MAG TPA: hypothetical protein VHM92_05075 [Allosphingosinicella sp.]|nr:hypothetical protein [Allosphingosinicella sp.]